jgi:hypothetical protein
MIPLYHDENHFFINSLSTRKGYLNDADLVVRHRRGLLAVVRHRLASLILWVVEERSAWK